ncbi:LysR family transcriptional regulator [Streptomyces sp. NPDC093109]|uniref:LysR family transcriptional regulator n=1 Tax=Streptomyces sp. NPDC093109 TaxID=3154977 RepID=UPI00344E04FD
MRIEQLEYIEAVTRLGSLRRAAEALHVSQPALSETVRNLERELGVDILDRRRSGARISAAGRELLPHIIGVLDAVDTLRRAADDQHRTTRMIRLGTVNAATVPLLVPTIQAFRAAHPETQVEVTGAQQAEIHRELLEGGLDLGLVNYLQGDDKPPGFHTTELLRGRPVVCVRSDSRLAALRTVSVADLLSEPLIVMRSGYVMHRYVHRLLEGRSPTFSYSTDGAEMGKLMVAEGLGTTVLPDFSVIGDPLERAGMITTRPLDADTPAVLMVIQHPLSATMTQAARDLHAMFVRSAETYVREAADRAATRPADQRTEPADQRTESADLSDPDSDLSVLPDPPDLPGRN